MTHEAEILINYKLTVDETTINPDEVMNFFEQHLAKYAVFMQKKLLPNLFPGAILEFTDEKYEL